MTALDHKAWHDLARMRGQAIAVAALVACAMAAWVTTALTERAMVGTRDAYYARERFADVFASARRAPESVAARLAAVPGVAEVETRVVSAGRIELPSGSTARGVFVSLPDLAPPRLNRLHVRAGRALLPDEHGAALVTEGFAEANRLVPGDDISAVVNGRRERLRVVGVALSPEYVYAIGQGMVFPDDRSFGVFWMARTDLGAAAGLEGAFNAAALRLAPGASEPAVIAAVDRILEPWGGAGAYGRGDQISHRFLSDEIGQLRAMSVVVPAIFGGIAAFLLSVIVSRLVAAQRQQIGMLKAIGYSDAAVALHYAKLVGAIVIAGAVLGAVAGAGLGRGLARMYASFYRFPFLVYEDAASVIAVGAGLSLLAAMAGVASAVRRAARLPPAEAMRPEPPARFRATRLDRLALVQRLPPAWKMIVRNLSRRPVRAALSTVGIACAVAVIVVAGAMDDALAHLLKVQFEQARREDAIVVFSDPTGRDALFELRAIPGVRALEPYRHVPATLRNGARSYRIEVAGLEPGGKLWRLVDVRERTVPVPPTGLVLSTQLARILAVEPGDTVIAEVHEGRRPVLSLRVVALVDDFVGVAATTSLAALDDALQEGPLASGALLTLDPGTEAAVEARLSARPRVAGVTLASTFRRAMEDVVARFMGGVVAVLIGFALVLAGGVLYNAARVAHAERERELATLRVLGFGVGEAWRILAGELAVLVAAAVPLGMALGVGLVALSSSAMTSDLFRLPVVVGLGTWAMSTGTVLAAAAVLILLARRWVARADLVEVLKARE
ncbi:ABC transporter permease [Anaeromyxobacter oryzae]|uniref:Peptide ABC transporter permease n=1 Tax=Anaeromyxobacter oryzae TaxID=2918170 RepID=A0ABM7WPP7_9BACT|nr:ABC transporter permease [Anaeromyxobacter oryzae]BDG01437.1 peptide ABC transporter permease [Anaeromyxobacter oryzae]